MYSEEEPVGGRGDITVVRNHENDRRYIRKLLTTYDKSIYEYLQGHPIAHMPRIIELYESSNCLIVIEEYIEGRTVDDILADTLVPEDRAVSIAKEICTILDELHRPPKPIVHRDIKPSNIIITPGDEVFLLDMNVAKWYDPDKTDDTHYMGTQYYAAPEQAGYGLKASSDRSDIYAVGMLLNVMITGHFPKEQRADGAIWPVIERCISLDAEDRYSAKELMAALEEIERKQ
jgi:serine/threonine protein kinase